MSECPKMQGIDTPYSLIGRCAAIKAAGKGFAIRYLSPNTANFPRKRLTAGEVQEAAKVGLWMGSIWEVMGNAAEMTDGAGKAHGVAAVQVATSVKQPAGSAIGFAVDYDAPESDFEKVADYFGEAHRICRDNGYLVTGYGSEAVLRYLMGLGLIHFDWLAGAPGWSESRFATGEAIDQTNAGNVNVAGLPVDLDSLTGVYAGDPSKAGLWLPKP